MHDILDMMPEGVKQNKARTILQVGEQGVEVLGRAAVGEGVCGRRRRPVGCVGGLGARARAPACRAVRFTLSAAIAMRGAGGEGGLETNWLRDWAKGTGGGGRGLGAAGRRGAPLGPGPGSSRGCAARPCAWPAGAGRPAAAAAGPPLRAPAASHAPARPPTRPPARAPAAAPERGVALLEGQHPLEGAGPARARGEHDHPLRQAEERLVDAGGARGRRWSLAGPARACCHPAEPG
jgi:hypothetical protein